VTGSEDSGTISGTTAQTSKKPSPSVSVLQGFFKPAVAAVMTAALSVMLMGAPNAAQAQGVQEPVRIERVLTAESHPLDLAAARILAADANQDGRVIGRSYGYELQNLDSLARAVYDYVDFVHPRGDLSVYGADGRGDYLEGGLGLGYSFRPKHMTGQNILLESDLTAGVKMLKSAIANPKTDQASQDLSTIREAAKTQLGVSSEQVDGAIWAATGRLLDRILQINNAKEIATRNSTALATHAEVLAGLTPGSLEKLIAETALGHETTHFSGAILEMAARRAAFGGRPRNEVGVAGDTAMHYILLVGKRAQEAHLVGEVLARLPR
jgi:hypothetical protein